MGESVKPGIYRISDEAYHADALSTVPALSRSLAYKIISQSPLHAWTHCPKLNPEWQPTIKAEFDIGRAAHRALLGRGGDYAVIPDDLLSANGAVSTKAAKEWVEEQRAAGRTPIKADAARAVERMAEVCRAALSDAGIVLDPEQSELTAYAEVDGVLSRCRVDNAPLKPVNIPGIGPRLVILDFKTTTNASPAHVRRSVRDWGYDLQGAFYPEVWQAASGEERLFLFVAQEKEEPHGVTIDLLLDEPGHSEDWGMDAREKCVVSRTIWRECLRTDRWPCYPSGINVIGAGSFDRQAWADRSDFLSQVSRPTRAALEAARNMQSPR